MSETIDEAVAHVEEGISPHGAVPVKLVETEKETPAIASVYSFVLQGNETPFQLLPHSDKRSRAVVAYALALGAAGTAFAYLARRNASAPSTVITSTFVLQTTSYTMSSFAYEAASELWLLPQATSAAILVSVLDEWYKGEQ